MSSGGASWPRHLVLEHLSRPCNSLRSCLWPHTPAEYDDGDAAPELATLSARQDTIAMRIALVCIAVLSSCGRADELPPGAVLRLGSPALRHNAIVRQVAWSRDGKRLASVAGDERI